MDKSIYDSLINGEYYWIKYSYSAIPNKWAIGEWNEKYQQFMLTNRSIVTPPHITELDTEPIKKVMEFACV